MNQNERNKMTEQPWVRHLTASDILDLQSREIMSPVVVGVSRVEAIRPSDVIFGSLEDRSWSIENFVTHLFSRTSWNGSSKASAGLLLTDLICHGKRIDDHAASMLSCGFDVTAKYWLDIQAAYDKAIGE